MSNQLVSVIMGVYNNEDTVKNAIDSILNQSYKNIELIITDDNSSDNSLSVIKNYQDQKNVKLIENKENIGLTKSLNLMIKASKGKLIARQDADDISLEKRIEVQVEQINKLLPELHIIPSFALVPKPINFRNILALVVPPQHKNFVRIFYFVSKKKADCLYTLLASINVVP